MKGYGQFAREAGPWMVAGVALAVALFAVGLVYAKLPDAVGLPLPTENKIIAATGSGLYDVEPFCNDPLTEVFASPSPDNEITYELLRVRDGKQEAVIWNGHTPGATHWWFDGGEQNSEPALVNGDAEKCIRDKAKPR